MAGNGREFLADAVGVSITQVPQPSINLAPAAAFADNALELLIAGLKGEIALDHHPRFVVRVLVQPGPVPGFGVIEDQRDCRPVICALEVPGREGVGVDYWHV